jgi:hypothetical protein
VSDLEVIGVSTIFNLIRRSATLARMCPTFDLNCEENTARGNGTWCWIVTGPVPLVLDLHITHERWGSSADPSIYGHLHYPNDLDRSLNEDVADKIRAYRADYNNRPSNAISIMSAIQ